MTFFPCFEAGTPYFGGCFHVRCNLSKDFPVSPPKAFFTTKIFHPNVSRDGEICVNTLKKDWKPDLGLKHVLLTIKCLLIVPNPESALNEEAGKLLLEHYDDYCRRAKMMTEIHARSHQLMKESDDNNKASSSKTEASTEDEGSSSSRNELGCHAKKRAGDAKDTCNSKPNQSAVPSGTRSKNKSVVGGKDKRRTLKRL